MKKVKQRIMSLVASCLLIVSSFGTGNIARADTSDDYEVTFKEIVNLDDLPGDGTPLVTSGVGLGSRDTGTVYTWTSTTHNEKKALTWTCKQEANNVSADSPSGGGIDFTAFTNAVTDWTGANEYWIHMDASEYGTEARLMFTLEEDGLNNELEFFMTKPFATVYLQNGDSWEEAVIDFERCIPLPAGFDGWIRVPLSSAMEACGGASGRNGEFDGLGVHCSYLVIPGIADNIDKSVYIDSLAIVGNVDGTVPPVSLDTNVNDGNEGNDNSDNSNNGYKELINMDLLPEDGTTLGETGWSNFFGGDLYTWTSATHNGKKSFAWTCNQVAVDPPGCSVEFGYDPSGVTEWVGAEEYWIHMDASEYGDDPIRFYFTLEEDEFVSGTQIGVEYFKPKDGSVVYIQNGDSWKAVTVDGSFITLPAGFNGWIRASLDSTGLNAFGGANDRNGKLDGTSVHNGFFVIDGTTSSIGKSIYIDALAIVGNISDSDNVPFIANETPDFEEVWGVEGFPIDVSVGAGGEGNRYGTLNGDSNRIVKASWKHSYGGKSLEWVSKNVNANPAGVSLFLQNDSTTQLDWSGAQEVWCYVDATEYGDNSFKFFICFEERDEKGAEWYKIKAGSYAVVQDGDSWVIAKADNGNFITLPAKFKGWVRYKLDADNFYCFGGSGNGVWDGENVYMPSFMFSSDETCVDKSVYLDAISIVRNINSEALPMKPLPSDNHAPVFGGELFENPNIEAPRNGYSGAKTVAVTDEDGDIYTLSVSLPAQHGKAYVNSTNKLTYVPEKDYTGTDSFTLMATDIWGASTTLEITVTVSGDGEADSTPDVVQGEITKADSPVEPELSLPATADSVISQIKDFNLEGYVGTRLANLTEKWTLNILENNPELFWNIAQRDSDDPMSNYGWYPAWYGEFPGKILTGMAESYKLDPSDELLAAGDEFVEELAKIQDSDGYLGAAPKNQRNTWGWDVWGQYHCMYGLEQWYQTTGNETARAIAVKNADYLYDFFIGNDKSFLTAGSWEMNLAISHGFTTMYKGTGDERYLEAAKKIVFEDWEGAGDWLNASQNGTDFYQTPSARWEIMYHMETLRDLYEIEQDPVYYQALEQIWWSMLKTDVHNTGGATSGEAFRGSPYHTAAIETDASVAWMALTNDYLSISKNSYVADELERTYFNALLGALMSDDYMVTYNTPMDGIRESVKIQCERTPGLPVGAEDLSCCSANTIRTLSQLANWGITNDEDNMYINYYGPSNALTQTPGGNQIQVLQETEYPLNGSIKITLSMEEAENFNMNFRIPVWAEGSTVWVNGESLGRVTPGEYCSVERTWKNGDVIQLELDMTVHYWVGEENYADKTSVYYGPILLALDSARSILPIEDVVLQTTDIENMKVVSGEGDNCILTATVLTVDNVPITLVDFASAGYPGTTYEGDISSTYNTWLNVRHNMQMLPFVKGGNPVWNNVSEFATYSINIDAGENGTITSESDAVVFGGSATFEIQPNDGYKIKDVLVDGISIGTVSSYTFTNVRKDHTIQAVFSSLTGEKEDAVNISELETLIAELDGLDLNKYTEESAAVFNEALEAAKTVLNDADATQEDVDAAVAYLRAVMKSLVLAEKEDTPNNGESDKDNSSSSTTGDKGSDKGNTSSPTTGDDTPVGLLLIVLAVSAACMAVLVVKKRITNK